jgi:hypothetical protein
VARDGRIFLSFEMRDGLTEEIRAAIDSGLTTTFVYDVELRRGVPLWIDRTVGAATISASVKFDNLTRFYHVSRMLDGRVDESRQTDDPAVAERLVTVFDRLPVFGTDALEPNVEYYVRIRARTRPHNARFFWPWGQGATASGVARFTFIPER